MYQNRVSFISFFFVIRDSPKKKKILQKIERIKEAKKPLEAINPPNDQTKPATHTYISNPIHPPV